MKTKKKPVTTIDRLRDEKYDLMRSMETITAIINKRLEEEYAKAIDGYDKYVHTISPYHECDESPVGVCVYNEPKDVCHDQCLYCEEPEERK